MFLFFVLSFSDSVELSDNSKDSSSSRLIKFSFFYFLDLFLFSLPLLLDFPFNFLLVFRVYKFTNFMFFIVLRDYFHKTLIDNWFDRVPTMLVKTFHKQRMKITRKTHLFIMFEMA